MKIKVKIEKPRWHRTSIERLNHYDLKKSTRRTEKLLPQKGNMPVFYDDLGAFHNVTLNLDVPYAVELGS